MILSFYEEKIVYVFYWLFFLVGFGIVLLVVGFLVLFESVILEWLFDDYGYEWFFVGYFYGSMGIIIWVIIIFLSVLEFLFVIGVVK